jgi:hypothetical protein
MWEGFYCENEEALQSTHQEQLDTAKELGRLRAQYVKYGTFPIFGSFSRATRLLGRISGN